MAKKERVETTFNPEVKKEEVVAPVAESQETMYESEAYGNPRPDQGTKTTVMKTVGIGGPVPIVAPKHNTIQLQPIIVPLAVVPYMSQDSSVLRTDGKPEGVAADGGSYAAVEFDAARMQAEKRTAVRRMSAVFRVYSLITFLVAAIIAPLPYLLDGSFSFEEIFATKEVETDEELLDKLLDMSEKQENSSAEKASAGIGGENRNIYITGSHQNDHAGEVNDGAKQIEGVYG